jgi:hypothetical protein
MMRSAPVEVVRPEVWLMGANRRITMRKKRPAEDLAAKLHQMDFLVAQGTPLVDAIGSIGVTEGGS